MVSPMPPAKSGIADYSAALAEALGKLADVRVISAANGDFDPAEFDHVLYQAGNNPHHGFVYEMALAHPGVVVLHEPNLHHLVAELTINRGDWDAYLREAEYDGGKEALDRAQRVRRLEAPPDYAGVKMIRRLLDSSEGVVVHSRFAEEKVREAGFRGPLARIPHGAWTIQPDRAAYRRRLGLDDRSPLVGIFGFLKPYKRIAESLRVLRRVRQTAPAIKMILAGEPHPDLPVARLIRDLGLSDSVRLLGFQAEEDFLGCMSACDIVLSLRNPTAGETSGSLMRALGMGKAVVVSEVGAFQELPEDVCLKAPVDETEEAVLTEYLRLLVSRPALARDLGERARQWAERECAWALVARSYLAFLEDLGRARRMLDGHAAARQSARLATTPVVDEILKWTPADGESRTYVEQHLTRLEDTLKVVPRGGPSDRILEMGAYMQITPLLERWLGYGEVWGCYLGPAGKKELRRAVSADGRVFECEIELFNAEKDPFPYPDGHFATVLCCELLEHLAEDPMHMMAEINRVLGEGGHLVLTTPNIASFRSVSAVLQGYHPGLYPAYLGPEAAGREARHHREYTPAEIQMLLADAGFEVTLLKTGAYRAGPEPEPDHVARLLESSELSPELRGDVICAVGRKAGPPRHRYPSWLYSGPQG